MAGVNRCIFIGNLTRSPEVRYDKAGGAITSFSIACNESWKGKDGQKQERVEYVNITAFGKLGEICGEYLDTGKQVYIEGRMQTDKYEKDDITKYSTKIVANNMTMLGQRENPGTSQQDNFEYPKCKETPCNCEDFEEDDIPF